MTDVYRSAEQALWRTTQVMPTEQLVSVEKPKLKVRVQQTGDGPPAIFIHGAMTAGTSFAPLMARLPQLRCIALDRPGCGLSDAWSLSPEFRAAAIEVLDGLLDGLGVKKAIFVGNSMGGLWCTWYALARPERVSQLMMLGPSIGMPGVHVPVFMRLLSVPGVRALMKKKMKPSAAALRGIFTEMGHGKSLAAGKIPKEVFDWGVALQTFTATSRNELDLVHRAVGFTGARPWVQLPPEELAGLRVPTLVLSGTDDTHGGPELARRVAGLVPGSTLTIVNDAGHVPWLDDAERVAAAVRSACTSDAPRSATG